MEELEERAEELEEVQNTVNVGLAGVHNKESVEESTDKQNKENLNETEVAPVYVENIKFRSSLHSLNEEIQSTIEKKVSLDAKVTSLKSDLVHLDELHNINQHRIASLRRTDEELKEAMSIESQRLQGVKIYVEHGGSIIDALNTLMAENEEKLKTVDENVTRLQGIFTERSAALNKLDETFNDMVTNHENVMQQLNAEKQEKHDLYYTQFMEKTKILNSLLSKKSEVETSVKNITCSMAELQSKLESQKLMNEEGRRLLEEKKETLAQIMTENSVLKERMEAAELKHKEQCAILKEQLEAENVRVLNLQSRYENLKAIVEKDNELLQEKHKRLAELEAKISDTKALEKKTNEEMKRIEEENQGLEQALTEYRIAKRKEQETIIYLLKKEKVLEIETYEITQLEANKNEMQRNLDKITAELNTKLEQVQDMKVKVSEQQLNWTEKKSAMEDELRSLQRKLVISREEKKLREEKNILQLEAHAQQLAIKKNHVENLKEQLDDKEALLSAKREDYEIKLNLKNKLEDEKNKLMEELEVAKRNSAFLNEGPSGILKKTSEVLPHKRKISAYKDLQKTPERLVHKSNAEEKFDELIAEGIQTGKTPFTPTKKVRFSEIEEFYMSSEDSQATQTSLTTSKTETVTVNKSAADSFRQRVVQEADGEVLGVFRSSPEDLIGDE